MYTIQTEQKVLSSYKTVAMGTLLHARTSTGEFVTLTKFLARVAPNEAGKFKIGVKHRTRNVKDYFKRDVDIKERDEKNGKIVCVACKNTVNVLDPYNQLCWSVDRWLTHKTFCTDMQ